MPDLSDHEIAEQLRQWADDLEARTPQWIQCDASPLHPARLRRQRRRRTAAVVAAAVVLLVGVLVYNRVGSSSVTVTAANPGANPGTGDESSASTSSSSSSTTGGMAPCVMSRSSDGSGALAQPATITLPSGNTFAIRPGNPITAPSDVTLDGDGSAPGAVSDPSVVGGQAANSLLWGAATPNGPFAEIEHVAVGSTITLDQTQPSPCRQDWRVVSITSSDVQNGPSSRPSLTLVGFQPTNGRGPNVLFYVDAVPA
jgi:hypothetical protein